MLHIPHRREPQDAGNCRRQTESSLPPKKPPQRPAAVSRPGGCRCPVAPQATGARPRGAGRRAVQRLTAPLFLRRKFDGVRRRAVVSLPRLLPSLVARFLSVWLWCCQLQLRLQTLTLYCGLAPLFLPSPRASLLPFPTAAFVASFELFTARLFVPNLRLL